MLKKINWPRLWKSRKKAPSREYLSTLFRFKYSSFRMLLESNAEFLKILADLEVKLQGEQIFGMSFVQSQSTRAIFHTLRMVKNLDDLSQHHYPALFGVLDKINAEIKAVMGARKELPEGQFILPYSEINAEMVDGVGGKNAHLGEMVSRLDLPVPEGFAVSTQAFQAFFRHNDLFDEINRKKMEIDPVRPETITQASEEIQGLILRAPLPPVLEDALYQAYDDLTRKLAGAGPERDPVRVALRSSAIGEDSELSFAGQYLSILNVSREKLLQGYTMVVASLYTPRAISYRLNKGIRDEDIAMSVACLELIDSVASGVMYSRHPFKSTDKDILINAVWGLGPYAVDGVVTPDTYRVSQNDRFNILVSAISSKTGPTDPESRRGVERGAGGRGPDSQPLPLAGSDQHAGRLRAKPGKALSPAPGYRVGPGPGGTPAAAAVPAPAGAVVLVGGTSGLCPAGRT